ncbi:MAG: hypothetical protein JNK21_12055 [Rhodospirillaceae bacterium]|nr:hypothetical protein [Rhodospirillaceae bacterium]
MIRLIAITILIISSFHATLAAAEKVCSTDTTKLHKYAGVYPKEQFLLDLIATRSVMEAKSRAYNSVPTEIRIYDEGILVTYDWHEADEIVEECIVIEIDHVRLGERKERYTRPGLGTSPYFDALFSGCFIDEAKEEWCFNSGGIGVGNAWHKAQLILDLSELPLENSVAIDDSEELWFFRPLQNGGWHVFKGSWLTSEKPPVDWNRPWRTLTPSP